MKKWLLRSALAVSILLCAGCGSTDPQDNFTFGSAGVTCADSSASLTLPFELAEKPQNGAQESVTASGSNKDMQVIAIGMKTDKDIKDVAGSSAAVLKNNPIISNLKTETKEAKLQDRDAEVLQMSFTETDNGKKTDLTIIEYVIRDKDVLWRVIYQCRTADEKGKKLMDYTAGKITFSESAKGTT